MSDQPPKDETLGQAMAQIKGVIPQVNPKLEQAKKALSTIIGFVSTNSSSGSELHNRAVALKAGIDSGITNAEEAVTGAEQLIKEFSVPLALLGGTPLHGSGALVQGIEQGYKGLQSAMTEAQKVIAIATPALQCAVIIIGTIISFYPQVGLWGIGGGITLSRVIAILAGYLNVRYSRYPDAPAPRAELVALPK